MKTKIFSLAFGAFLFSFSFFSAEYKDINVYLKFSPELNDYIASFNTHLESDGLIKKYDP